MCDAVLFCHPGLDIGPNDEVRGVQTFFGMNFAAKGVVLTTGTFMNGRIWVGRASMAAGRAGEAPSTGLTETLVGMGFETDRLKTGTPARVDSRTVNFQGLEEQPGEDVRGWVRPYERCAMQSMLLLLSFSGWAHGRYCLRWRLEQS
jgi:glucose-inhibited division protein A